jgi:hypothetical protein
MTQWEHLQRDRAMTCSRARRLLRIDIELVHLAGNTKR